MDFIIDCLAVGELLDGESNPAVDAILNLSEFHYHTPLIFGLWINLCNICSEI